MPVECTFSDGANDTTIIFSIDTTFNTFNLTRPFYPTWIALDRNGKISDAITDHEQKITSKGLHTFSETNVALSVSDTGAGSSIVRIEHNWVKPDGFKGINPGIRLSDYHYWKVDGIFSPGLLSKAIFFYDGSTSLSSGYLDNTLILSGQTEDSLVILYRKNTADDWSIVNGYTHNKGSSTDKKGSFNIDTLKKGEYVLGYRDHTAGISSNENVSSKLSINPNPVTGGSSVTLTLSHTLTLSIFDITGRKIFQEIISPDQKDITFQTTTWKSGIYFIRMENANGNYFTGKLAVQ